MVSVANQRKTKFGEYISRPCILGNPFVEGIDGTREEVIEKYRIWLLIQIETKNDIYDELIRFLNIARQGNLILLCYCKPLNCHGDVIKEWIDNQLLIEKQGNIMKEA